MFTLNEDQIAVREMALAFAAENLAPHAVEWDERKYFPVDVLRAAASLGMGGVYVAGDIGGSALSRLDAALIFEALATGCPSISAYISIHNMSSWMIDRFGAHARAPAMATQALHHGYARELLPDRAGLRLRCRRAQDSRRPRWRLHLLNGQKQLISGAGSGDVYIVMVRTGSDGPAGISTFVVPGDTTGLSLGVNERKMGWNAQPTRAVIFENARVTVANRLGEEGIGFKIAMAGLDGGRGQYRRVLARRRTSGVRQIAHLYARA